MQLKSVQTKAAMVAWYVKRPTMYPDLVRHLVHVPMRLIPSVNDSEGSQQAARVWCRDNLTPIDAFAKTFNIPAGLLHVETLHEEDWEYAQNAVKYTPVSMGGGGDTDLLYTLCLHLQATRVVETGVAYGWSSLALLLALNQFEDGKLYSTDRPYPMRDNEPYVGCVVPDYLRPRWSLMRRADRDGLPRILKQLDGIDLAHYDSDKSYNGRIYGYTGIWSKLRQGGVLVSDDIGDNLAFRDFSALVNRRSLVLSKSENDYVGLLIK